MSEGRTTEHGTGPDGTPHQSKEWGTSCFVTVGIAEVVSGQKPEVAAERMELSVKRNIL